MSFLAAAGSGIAIGVLHGLGPDHCAALASLLVRDGQSHGTARLSLKFGLGHALALGGLGLAAAASGLLIPESWERNAEVLAGALLIVVGVLAIRARDSRVLLHRHAHEHDGERHEHWHAHVGEQATTHSRHRHPHLATLVGGGFGLSGVRALTLALPPLLVAGHSWVAALAFVLCFGLGVALSMVAFGLVFQLTKRRMESAIGAAIGGAWLSAFVGVIACGLGVYWIASNLM